MPTYLIKDPQSGKSLKLTGDSPPTEQELNDIFSSIAPAVIDRNQQKALPETQQPSAIAPVFNPGRYERFASQGREIRQNVLENNPPVDQASLAKAAALPEYLTSRSSGVSALTTDSSEQAAILKGMGIDVRSEGGLHFVYKDDVAIATINKPGFSNNDMIGLLSEIATGLPVGKFASLGKTVFTKALRAFGAEILTQGAREGTQASFEGGSFDPVALGINTLLATGGEAIVPLIKGLWSKLTPKQRSIALQSETMKDLVDAGISEKELRATLERSDGFAELTGRNADLYEVAPERIRTQMSVLSSEDAARTRFVEGKIENRIKDQYDKVDAAFAGAPDVGSATGAAAKSASEILENAKVSGQDFVSGKYAEAWEGTVPIDVLKLRRQAKSILDNETLFSSVPERKVENIRKQLLPKKYIKEVEAAVKAMDDILSSDRLTPPALKEILNVRGMIKSGTMPAHYAPSKALRDLGITLPDPPKMEMGAQDLQKVIWAIRDAATFADGGVNASVRKTLEPLEEAVVRTLNKQTDGLYSLAEDAFKKFKNAMDALQTGVVGKAGGAKETTLKVLDDLVFSPTPANRLASKKFMRILKSVNPEAATDMFKAHFKANMGKLPPNPNAEQVLKVLFGDDANSRKVIYELAAIVDPKLTRQLHSVETVLKAQKGVVGLSSKAADIADIPRKLEKISDNFARIGLFIMLTLQRKRGINASKFLMTAATDPRWHDSWVEILRRGRVSARARKQRLGFEKESVQNLTDYISKTAEEMKASWRMADPAEILAPGLAAGAVRDDSRPNIQTNTAEQ